MEEIFIISCGFLFGFPIGSKLTADFYQKEAISRERAQILCTFTNNLSPVFVSGYVCTTLFHRTDWILPVYLCLYLPAFCYGMMQLLRHPATDEQLKKPASQFCICMQNVDAGIINSFYTLIKLCGYIILFSILSKCISHITFLPKPVLLFLNGNLEITNGITLLSQTSNTSEVQFVLMILFLSFGGVSGLAQTGSMLSDTDLSLKAYIKHKLLIVLLSTVCAIFYLLILSILRNGNIT
jgi:hypothetical protein